MVTLFQSLPFKSPSVYTISLQAEGEYLVLSGDCLQFNLACTSIMGLLSRAFHAFEGDLSPKRSHILKEIICRARHIMAEGENLSKHAAIASQKALEMAGVEARDIDLILLATSSPDDLFGSAGQV
jgi:3-oxoacyl-[acyl-carrier-protein] synthase III